MMRGQMSVRLKATYLIHSFRVLRNKRTKFPELPLSYVCNRPLANKNEDSRLDIIIIFRCLSCQTGHCNKQDLIEIMYL